MGRERGWGQEKSAVTAGVSESPASGDAGRSPREVVSGLGQADGGHAIRQLSWSGQFDQGDVVVDGQHVELGVLEDLKQAALLSAPAAPARVPGAGYSTGISRDLEDQRGPQRWLLCLSCRAQSLGCRGAGTPQVTSPEGMKWTLRPEPLSLGSSWEHGDIQGS